MLNKFINFRDIQKVVNLIIDAKLGDKSAQKFLYDGLKAEIDSFIYWNYNHAKNLGLSCTDLEGLCSDAYMKCIASYNPALGLLTTYYRFVYSNLLLNLIRNQYTSTHALQNDAIKCNHEGTLIENEPASIFAEEEERKHLESDELVKLVLKEDNKLLNNTEKMIIEYSLNDVNLLNISKIMDIRYHKVCGTYEKALKKIKKYIKLHMPEIYSGD